MNRPISTRAHGIIDLAYASTLLTLPFALGWGRRATRLSVATAVATLGTSLMTKYEFGLLPIVPMKGHLAMDAAESSLLMAAPRMLAGGDADAAKALAVLGLVGAMVGSLTQTESPLERRRLASA